MAKLYISCEFVSEENAIGLRAYYELGLSHDSIRQFLSSRTSLSRTVIGCLISGFLMQCVKQAAGTSGGHHGILYPLPHPVQYTAIQ